MNQFLVWKLATHGRAHELDERELELELLEDKTFKRKVWKLSTHGRDPQELEELELELLKEKNIWKKDHRKNCQCWSVSLLIVRCQRLSWIQFLDCQNCNQCLKCLKSQDCLRYCLCCSCCLFVVKIVELGNNCQNNSHYLNVNTFVSEFVCSNYFGNFVFRNIFNFFLDFMRKILFRFFVGKNKFQNFCFRFLSKICERFFLGIFCWNFVVWKFFSVFFVFF